MKKAIIMLACLIVVVTLTGCSEKNTTKSGEANNSSNETKTVEPLNLYGEWKQTNSESDEDYQEATISEDGTITINWVTEDTKSLYWAGSFEAPTNETKSYSWTSNNDTSKTDGAMLASSDATKDFKYENGVLSYEASAMGVTKTIKMEKK